MTINLGFAIGLKSELAIKYIQKKGVQIPKDWNNLHAVMKSKSTDMADKFKLDILQKVNDEIKDSIKTGKSFQQFKKDLKPNMEKWGFWGKKADRVEGMEQWFAPWRLKLIYTTQVSEARSAGRYKRQWATRKTLPVWVYKSALTARTRDNHRIMHGTAFPANHPIWDQIYPPNGYNCKCWIDTMSTRMAEKRGYVVNNPIEDGEVSRQVSKNDSAVDTYKIYKDPETNTEYMHADKGWNKNAAKEVFEFKLDKYDLKLQEIYNKKRGVNE